MAITVKTMLLLNNSDRIRRLPFLVFHIVWVLFATSSLVPAQNSRIEAKKEAIDQFAYSGPLFLKGKSNLAELRLLDSVLHEQHEEKSNPYDEKLKDEFVSLDFDGLEIYGRIDKRVSMNFLPIRIKITSPKWSIWGGLDIGADAKMVKNKLGTPTKNTVGSEEYCGETECVVFYVKSGKISGVEFFYYAD